MSLAIPEEGPNVGFIGDMDTTASITSGADRSMTKPGVVWLLGNAHRL